MAVAYGPLENSLARIRPSLPQAARSLGDFTLVSCSVAPEFRFEGFRLLADDPAAQAGWPLLLERYPELL